MIHRFQIKISEREKKSLLGRRIITHCFCLSITAFFNKFCIATHTIIRVVEFGNSDFLFSRFFNFLAHATQSIGLSSVRTLAYSFSEVYLVLLNQTKTAKTAASDYYLPMLVIVTSFFLPESPRIVFDPGAFRLYWVYPT